MYQSIVLTWYSTMKRWWHVSPSFAHGEGLAHAWWSLCWFQHTREVSLLKGELSPQVRKTGVASDW